MMTAPKPAQASTVAANTLPSQLVSQIATAIESLKLMPASVTQEWIGQLNSLIGQQ